MNSIPRSHLLILYGVVALCLGQACTPFAPLQKLDSETSSSSSSIAYKSDCVKPAGINGSPQTIEEATNLINALPKPLSVACFLQSLDRPLNIALTNNTFSAQPAVGSRSPRIFILGSKLIISVVPEGAGANTVEFSYVNSATTSIKAEVGFPVIANLPLSAPLDRVVGGPMGGTLCAACHTGERFAPEINYANAFQSTALQPKPSTVVPFADFVKTAQGCNYGLEPDRCAVIFSIMNFGVVQPGSFPSTFTHL